MNPVIIQLDGDYVGLASQKFLVQELCATMLKDFVAVCLAIVHLSIFIAQKAALWVSAKQNHKHQNRSQATTAELGNSTYGFLEK